MNQVAGKLKSKFIFDRRATLFENEPAKVTGRYLVVTDIHIGFEQKFRSSGVRIHPDVERMLSELEMLIKENSVTDLIINGDIKSGVDRILESEWENVPRFLTSLSKLCRVHVIPGNHDGGLVHLVPANIILEDINGMLLDDTLIMHGHSRPLEKFSSCRRLVIGHAHPIFKRKGSPLSGQPVWVFLKIRKKLIFKGLLENAEALLEVMVMPSFNPELAASGYQSEFEDDKSISSLGRDLKESEEAAIISLNGEIIGDISSLKNVL